MAVFEMNGNGGGGVSGNTYYPAYTASASSQSSSNYSADRAFISWAVNNSTIWYPNKTGFPTNEWVKATFSEEHSIAGVNVTVGTSAGTATNFIWEVLDANDNVLGELNYTTSQTAVNTEATRVGIIFAAPIKTTAIKIRAKSCESTSGLTYLGIFYVDIIAIK